MVNFHCKSSLCRPWWFNREPGEGFVSTSEEVTASVWVKEVVV